MTTDVETTPAIAGTETTLGTVTVAAATAATAIASRVRTVLAATAAMLTWLAGAATVLAQQPSPTPIVGDPRSPQEGPGLVGDPVLAIGGVLLVALITVGATLTYIRFTGGSRRDTERR